jgi:RNA polymerase sigma-70 factor (ECF subfamily)
MNVPLLKADSTSAGDPWFATTHWSVVLAAAQENSPLAKQALEQLCRSYWYPLYAYVRRRGYDVPDALDLTQAFFVHLLERGFPKGAARQRGKFRSFLLTALKYFLADEWDKLRAEKRGGGRTPVSLDAQDAEERYRLEPVDRMDAEKIFERRWATTLLNRVLERLQEEFAQAGKARVFEQLQPYLLGEKSAVTYAEVGAKLEMTEGAVKVAVHRMRQRYRELFREEIAHTVAEPGEVEDEMRHLFAAISG